MPVEKLSMLASRTATYNGKLISLKNAAKLVKGHKLNRLDKNGYPCKMSLPELSVQSWS